MAAMPDLDHLTLDDFRDVYEPSDDTYLLIDAIEADMPYLAKLEPHICLEIG
jgi:release factor glutamine methyltransferase